MKNKVIVLMGLSASGKDTLRSALNKLGYVNAVVHTTRPRRDCEEDGREYHFVDDDAYKTIEKYNMFSPCTRTYEAKIEGNLKTYYYGLTKHEIDNPEGKTTVAIVDYKGMKSLEDYLGDRMIAVYLGLDEPTRRERAINRGNFNIEEWQRREEKDNEEFKGVLDDEKVIVMNGGCHTSILVDYIKFLVEG